MSPSVNFKFNSGVVRAARGRSISWSWTHDHDHRWFSPRRWTSARFGATRLHSADRQACVDPGRPMAMVAHNWLWLSRGGHAARTLHERSAPLASFLCARSVSYRLRRTRRQSIRGIVARIRRHTETTRGLPIFLAWECPAVPRAAVNRAHARLSEREREREHTGRGVRHVCTRAARGKGRGVCRRIHTYVSSRAVIRRVTPCARNMNV